jgi:hypothetical protein
LDDQSKNDKWGIWHAWETRQVHTGFWWAEVRDRDQLEDPGIDRRIILKWPSRSEMGCMG